MTCVGLHDHSPNMQSSERNHHEKLRRPCAEARAACLDFALPAPLTVYDLTFVSRVSFRRKGRLNSYPVGSIILAMIEGASVIRTPGQRLRVFISSTLRDLEQSAVWSEP